MNVFSNSDTAPKQDAAGAEEGRQTPKPREDLPRRLPAGTSSDVPFERIAVMPGKLMSKSEEVFYEQL